MNSNDTIFAIDIGNTNLHWCYINNGKIKGEYKRNKHSEISHLPWNEIKKTNFPIVIAGTLNQSSKQLEQIKRKYNLNFIELNTKNQRLIKNIYPALGIDRVCALTAASRILPTSNSPIIVFDFGTATTITCCDSDRNFLGGLIHTGIKLELDSLSSQTVSLPKIDPSEGEKINKLNPLANNTKDAILHGTILGQIALCENFITSLEKETKLESKIVLTGGNANIINKFFKRKIDLFDQYLTIKGLYYLHEASLQ